jgi:hypothetical protein
VNIETFIKTRRFISYILLTVNFMDATYMIVRTPQGYALWLSQAEMHEHQKSSSAALGIPVVHTGGMQCDIGDFCRTIPDKAAGILDKFTKDGKFDHAEWHEGMKDYHM